VIDNAFDLSVLDAGTSEYAVAMARAGHDVALARVPFGTELSALIAFRSRIEDSIYGKQDRPKSTELSDYGKRLFAFAIRDDIYALYERLPRTHIRLHILSDQPELQRLPFEYLQEPKQPSGPSRHRSVVRIVPTVGMIPAQPITAGKLRVLFVSADPTDQGPVSWPEVKERIERTFSMYAPRDRVIFEAVEGTDRRTLRELIAQRDFDVLHFSGHGDVDENGKGRLILVNRKTQRSDPLEVGGLSRMLSGRALKLVILSACNTAAGDFRDDFAVTGKALVHSGIPAVVANQLPVPDDSVAIFVGPLYEAILRTGDIDLAMGEGRIALADLPSRGDDATVEWGIPTLYRHVSSPIIYIP
jgi:hypothetical protein